MKSKTIVKIEDLPEQKVIDISTSTHTFVANGLKTHNCFDEIFFTNGGNSFRAGDRMIGAVTPATQTFGKQKLIMYPSSPWGRAGKVYEMYLQGQVAIDSNLEEHDEQTTSKNREKEAESVDIAKEAVSANPTIFVAQLESWRLYEHYLDESFVPTYHGGFRPVHAKLVNENGDVMESDVVTNAKTGEYIQIEDNGDE